MHTGLGAPESATPQEIDFMRKVFGVLRVMMKHAVQVADEFARTCGRTRVHETDMRLALQFLAHEFWQRDIEQEFLNELAEEEGQEEGEAEGEEEGEE